VRRTPQGRGVLVRAGQRTGAENGAAEPVDLRPADPQPDPQAGCPGPRLVGAQEVSGDRPQRDPPTARALLSDLSGHVRCGWVDQALFAAVTQARLHGVIMRRVDDLVGVATLVFGRPRRLPEGPAPAHCTLDCEEPLNDLVVDLRRQATHGTVITCPVGRRQ
jgi:hypothetical protein